MDVEENEQVGYGDASNNQPSKQLQCSKCDRSFTRTDNKFRHEKLCGLTHKCSKCGKEFSRLCTKSKYEQMCRKVDYNCSDCSRVFTSLKELKIHHQSSHKPLSPMNRNPQPSTSREDNDMTVNRDGVKCGSGKQLQCSKCDRSFNRKDNKFRHEKLCGLTHKCSKCGKEFSRLCTKSKHEQRCRKIDYNCSDCSRVFTSINELIHNLQQVEKTTT